MHNLDFEHVVASRVPGTISRNSLLLDISCRNKRSLRQKVLFSVPEESYTLRASAVLARLKRHFYCQGKSGDDKTNTNIAKKALFSFLLY